MSTDFVLFDAADGIATITMNQPDRLNVFTPEMLEALLAAFKRSMDDKTVRVILLTGAGRAFSAGQDLIECEFGPGPDGSGPDLGDSLRKHYNPLIRAICRSDRPVVAAVNGPAAGAGANIALACDIVIAARGAVFIQAFRAIGLIPDAGGTFHLPRLVGHARATALAMLGEPVSAEQAEAWGMIWKCVDDDKLMEVATETARSLADGPGKALSLIKEALHASATNSLGEQLELERMLQQVAGKTRDYQEGVTAFLDKRSPKFEGR